MEKQSGGGAGGCELRPGGARRDPLARSLNVSLSGCENRETQSNVQDGANYIYTTLRPKVGKIGIIGLRCIPAMSTFKVIAVSNICVKFINQLE